MAWEIVKHLYWSLIVLSCCRYISVGLFYIGTSMQAGRRKDAP